MTPERAAIALRRLASGLTVSARTASNLRARGLAVEFMRALPMSRRWRSVTGVSRVGARWLSAYDEAPFGVELPPRPARSGRIDVVDTARKAAVPAARRSE